MNVVVSKGPAAPACYLWGWQQLPDIYGTAAVPPQPGAACAGKEPSAFPAVITYSQISSASVLLSSQSDALTMWVG